MGESTSLATSKCPLDCVQQPPSSRLEPTFNTSANDFKIEDSLLKLGQTIKSYILWTHPRGGLHYDVMVTIILAFIFLTPRSIFKDSPNSLRLHRNEIVVRSDGPNNFMYELNASGGDANDFETQKRLKAALEPVAGEIEITRYEALRDNSGKITGYRVWAHR